MKKIILILLICFLCSSSAALGFVVGSSNFVLSEYPRFYKSKPMKPIYKDSLSATMYQSDVENYTREADRYIDACKNDIQRIVENAEDARNSANAVIREYNNYIQYGF